MEDNIQNLSTFKFLQEAGQYYIPHSFAAERAYCVTLCGGTERGKDNTDGGMLSAFAVMVGFTAVFFKELFKKMNSIVSSFFLSV